MNREIKFRAWDGEKMLDVELGERYEWLKQTKAPPLMQYIGLHDKNGVEIFENDWINTKNGSHFVMVWDEKSAAFMACGNDTRFKGAWVHPVDGVGPREEWEIIGNIYENPELLTKTV